MNKQKAQNYTKRSLHFNYILIALCASIITSNIILYYRFREPMCILLVVAYLYLTYRLYALTLRAKTLLAEIEGIEENGD